MSNAVNTGDNMVSNNNRSNNALLFLKVAPNTTVGDDGVLSIAFNFNDKEQVEHYRKAATSILNWIDMNEQTSGGNATVRAGQVRRYKTRKEISATADSAWPNENYPHFKVIGQVGDKPVWAVQDIDGKGTRMVRTVDLENNTHAVNEVRAGQVRRYKTRKELGISDDIGWTHDDSPNFVVVGQVGDKSAWAIQDVNGQNSRMVRTVDLENNTLVVGEA